MVITAELFLYENDPYKNLESLANFDFSDTSGTKCTTENAYKKVPWINLSTDNVREISLAATGFTAFAAPLYLYLAKTYECYRHIFNLEWTKSGECWRDRTTAFSAQLHSIQYLSFVSKVLIGGIAAYVGARWYFQDKAQAERFQMLDKAYSAAAQSLTDHYGVAKKQDKPAIVEIARRLSQNCELIRISLCEAVRLSPIQAKLLTEKISRAALRILDFEKLAGQGKIDQTRDAG
jgi:hypothetical protein